jgi:hypothetical protein
MSVLFGAGECTKWQGTVLSGRVSVDGTVSWCAFNAVKLNR